MKVNLLTNWKDNILECCCLIKNKCNKDCTCEELEFTLDPFANSKDCMKHDSYKRNNRGAIQQRRCSK